MAYLNCFVACPPGDADAQEILLFNHHVTWLYGLVLCFLICILRNTNINVKDSGCL